MAQPHPSVPHAFVVSEDRSSIQIVDVEAERVVDVIDVPGGQVKDIESSPDGDRIYLLDKDTIVEYDTATSRLLRQSSTTCIR